MNLKPWAQELMWVQRNENNVPINYSHVVPQTDYIIPTIPRLVKKQSNNEKEQK
jgi:hypothetical protein